MKLEKVEQAMTEASERVREALLESDASAPVGCAVAVFSGSAAIIGSSGAIDCRTSASAPGAGPSRFELEPGESIELAPRFTARRADDSQRKRMATEGEQRVTRLPTRAPRPAGDEDDESARVAVAQRVLDTAMELEALIKAGSRGAPGPAGTSRAPERAGRTPASDILKQAANETHLGMQFALSGDQVADVVKLFGNWPLWNVLSPSEQAKLAAAMHAVRLRDRQPVPEDEALMLVGAGLVEQRRPGVIHTMSQGEAVYLEVFAGGSPHGPAVAVGATTLFSCERRDVMGLLQQDADLSARFAWGVARELAIHHGPLQNPFLNRP